MSRTLRQPKPTAAERRALRARLNEAVKVRRHDAGVDPELLLAAVVWPIDQGLKTLEPELLGKR